MFGFRAMGRVALLIAGCWWCKEIFSRFRSDVVELKEGDWTCRSVILLMWIVTAVILYLICTFVLGVAAKIYRFF